MQRGGSLLGGVLQDRISGEVDWQQKSYPLGGDGTHALIWVYSKDSGSESGSDRGWVDYLQWTPSGGGGSSTTDWEQITYTYDPSGRRIATLVSPPGGGDVDGVVMKAAGGPRPTLHQGFALDAGEAFS